MHDTVPASLSLVSFKDDMQFAFLLHNFVWATYGSPWLHFSAEGKLGSLSKQTSHALAQCTFGRHHGQSDIELSGATHYGQAVSQLRHRLGDTRNAARAELLVPILILLLHSSSTAQRDDSASHVMGLYSLLIASGPQAFQEEPVRQAFSSCRATLLTVGLLRKRRLFLEATDWLTEPWALGPSSKTAQDELVDILIHQPGFLEDAVAVRRPEGSLERRSDLVSRVYDQLDLLYQWRWRWEVEHPHAVWENRRLVASSSLRWTNRPAEAKKALSFTFFARAVEISLYNAVLICFLGLLYALEPVRSVSDRARKIGEQARPAAATANATILLRPGEEISLRASAIEIVRSFEYQLLNARNTKECALFWLFPLGLAGKVLEDDADMTAWIQEMLDTSQVIRGYGRGDNAFGFGFYELPKLHPSP